MYHWVEELSPPLTISSVAPFLAWNNGSNRLLPFTWCSPEAYGSTCKASMSVVTCKSEHKCWEVALLDPTPCPLGSPLASLPLTPFSLICPPTLGPDASLVLLISPSFSPRRSLLCPFSSFPLSEAPSSLHLSTLLVIPPRCTPASPHKMKHVRSQESDPYGQLPYPETQKYKVTTERLQGNPPPSHSLGISFSIHDLVMTGWGERLKHVKCVWSPQGLYLACTKQAAVNWHFQKYQSLVKSSSLPYKILSFCT